MYLASRDKVVATFIAAHQKGLTPIYYPTTHALIYFLSRNEGIKFEDYAFGMTGCGPFGNLKDPVSYPQSVHLISDLSVLSGLDLLSMRTSSMVKYELGQRAIDNQEKYIDSFNKSSEVQFPALSQKVSSALSDPRQLFERCYRKYLSEQ